MRVLKAIEYIMVSIIVRKDDFISLINLFLFSVNSVYFFIKMVFYVVLAWPFDASGCKVVSINLYYYSWLHLCNEPVITD